MRKWFQVLREWGGTGVDEGVRQRRKPPSSVV